MEWISNLFMPQTLLLVLLGLLLPLSIFIGRRNVRIRRRELLEKLIAVVQKASGTAELPPALELARARYTHVEAEGAGAQRRGGGLAAGWEGWLREIGIYLLPTTIFVLLSACGFALILDLRKEWLQAMSVLLSGLHAPAEGPEVSFETATALVIGAGFVGAYIWSINYLILRIANFDLSPLSFLRTSVHIVMTVLVVWVLRQVVAATPAGETLAVAVLLGIAFVSGLFPALGLRVLVDRLPRWLHLKRDVAGAADISRHFPLDLIDGIDFSVSFRLAQLEITDAQNLATTNPVMLYLETPYDFCQIIDWVAQAQLLCELGPERFLQARKEGIRDMIAFLEAGRTLAGRSTLRSLLGAGPEADDAELEVRFRRRVVKPHVRQLNRWWQVLVSAAGEPMNGDPTAATSGGRERATQPTADGEPSRLAA